ncbi:MAG: crotonobetainyl-CoA:carnitine CoA-transferase CaiB-like acyl-CoA transferase [Bermanella sp.]|jgi:crotonobetainyl-CoA:carnitine CoA-transferase CaiB-like acyl-CoA transferase
MTQPLKSLKVLDFSTLLPGPYATLMMADMGAQVLRIESPTRPDLVRALPPMDISGHSAAHSYLNRNKKAMALDLKNPEALAIIHALIAEYDVVVEQFRPGVMARLGLDYASLKKINPKLIYCSITGYGQTGPLKDRAGHDINYLALSGIADYSRRKNQKPVPQAVQIADIAGGSHHAVMGVLAAVIQRSQTGEGQHLDISMTDCAFSLNAMFASGMLGGEVEPLAEATMLNGGSFYDYYETADERYMSVGSLEPQFLMQLCDALEIKHLIGKAGSQKAEDIAQFKQAIGDKIQSQSFEYWIAIFAKLDCCVEPVLTLKEASEQPHAIDRNWLSQAKVTDDKTLTQLSNPIYKPSKIKNTGGAIGEDSISVLIEAGFSQSTIDHWKSNKVIK